LVPRVVAALLAVALGESEERVGRLVALLAERRV
jgi:hypothetical protein